MKQHVDITLRLSLWIDAELSEDEIRTFVRTQLAKAFGEPMSHMKEPLAILHIRQEAQIYGTADGLIPFDAYEIHGVREFGTGRRKHCEQVADRQAQFFSLYGHIPGAGLDCIGDFKTRSHAEEVYARITGRPYSTPTKEGK